MNRKFSPKVKKIIQQSREEAIKLGQSSIGTEHFLLGILEDKDSLTSKVFDSLEIDVDVLKTRITESNVRKVQMKRCIIWVISRSTKTLKKY